MGWLFAIGFIVIVVLAVVFLKGFDRLAGRGPGQISNGLKEYDKSKQK